jgi:hypothetical protein
MKSRIPGTLVLTATVVAAGCGGAKQAPTTSAATTAPPTSQATPTSTSPGALQAEAGSAATGDIPDNQVYLAFRSRKGWSIKYPEGWARSGSPDATIFRDKNNIVRIVIRPGKAPVAAQVRHDPSLRAARITTAPTTMSVKGSRAIKIVYTTQSAPNSVTGKRVTLTVDRYYLAAGGKVATVDLGTPVGVDNVDAYRLMIESFRWR